MAKGCLDRLTGNVLVTCEIAPVGVSDLYLIYPEDVTFTFRFKQANFRSFVRFGGKILPD